MPKKLYPGQRPPDLQAPGGTEVKSNLGETGRLIFNGCGILFGLLLLLVAIVAVKELFLQPDDKSSASSSALSADEGNTEEGHEKEMQADDLPYVRDLPLEMPTITTEKTKSLSANALELKSLWQELHRFRFDPKFHILGFDPCCRYAEWAGEVRYLDEYAGQSLLKETGVVPGNLLALAREYRRSKGNSTETTKWREQEFAGALNRAKREQEQARVTMATTGCRDFDLWARSARADEEGRAEEGSMLLDQAGCQNIAAGALVSKPTARKAYDFSDGSGSWIKLLVEHNGRDVWVPENDLDY